MLFLLLVPDDMFQAVVSRHLEQDDIIIQAAAVADYKPTTCHKAKSEKEYGRYDLSFRHVRRIFWHIWAHRKEGTILCGFSMETERMLEYAHGNWKKLIRYDCGP